ncbi:MAG: hypothetical protein ACYC27_15365 [Armatimonadota bacterium]
MENNDQQNDQQPEVNPPAPESTYSSRKWRACCLAPTLALGVLLILTLGASLFSPRTRLPNFNPAPNGNANDPAKRQAFIQFGKDYFAVAKKADEPSEAAFKEMDAFVKGNSSIDNVHASFIEAAAANARASDEFRTISIPNNLSSQDKLRKSLDSISNSYDIRREACEILAVWNGDVRDSATSRKYTELSKQINDSTRESLRNMMEAARDNGLTMDDIKEFAPASFAVELEINNILMSWPDSLVNVP